MQKPSCPVFQMQEKNRGKEEGGFPGKRDDFAPHGLPRQLKAEKQKDSIFLIPAAKSNALLVFANQHAFLSVPSRKRFYTFICTYSQILAKMP